MIKHIKITMTAQEIIDNLLSSLPDPKKSEKPTIQEQPICEELDEEIKRYGKEEMPFVLESDLNDIARHFYELGRQSKAFYAEELDEEIIRYKVPFVNEKENLDERTLNAIAYHFATWMESKLLHECESAYNNGYVAGRQSKETGFPTTDEEMEEFLATHPNVEAPDKYKTPDWLFKQEHPVCEGLDEEMIAWHKKHFKGKRKWEETSGEYLTRESQLDIARHFVQWQKDKDAKKHHQEWMDWKGVLFDEITKAESRGYHKGVEDGIIVGKEQMLKDAVEGEVVQDLKGVNRVKSFSKIPEWLYFGDKVRIVIVKED